MYLLIKLIIDVRGLKALLVCGNELLCSSNGTQFRELYPFDMREYFLLIVCLVACKLFNIK